MDLVARYADAPVPIKEQIVYQHMVSHAGQPDAACVHTFPLTFVVRYACAVRATTTYVVNRTIDEVATAQDPQHWAVCSRFFDDSYIAEREDSGDYPSGCGKDPRQKTPEPSPNSKWQDVLFEHFVMRWEPMTISWFKNLLDIAPFKKSRGYRYSLRRSLCSSVLGQQQPGGLETDSGYLKLADNQPGLPPLWTVVEAVKAVKFSRREGKDEATLDAWAWVLLWAMGEESASASCCKPDGCNC